MDELMDRAKNLRYKYKGNRVSIHLLTNARSGNCSQDCAYCAQSCRSKADIAKYKWVEEEKLYQDNDFVNDYHLSRHCIGLSGMKFTDEEIEELTRRIRKMKPIKGTPLGYQDTSMLTTEYCMKVLCLARIILQTVSAEKQWQ